MIVSFSGIDGAGKTTQIDLLLRYCDTHQITSTRKWSKARGTPGILFLKELVRRDKGMQVEEKLEYREKVFNSTWKSRLLLNLSLLDLLWYWGIYFRVIRNKYRVLILDRYIWDTYVEVSHEFNINLEKNFLWKCVKFVSVKPDKALLLVIPPEESLRRDLLKGEITTEEISIKTEKVNTYLKLKNSGKWNVIIDSTKGIDETFENIKKALGV